MSPAGADDGKLVRLRPPRKCPECGAPADRRLWPFCSRRCADLDLNRWLSGQYRIPDRGDPDMDEDGVSMEEGGAGAGKRSVGGEDDMAG